MAEKKAAYATRAISAKARAEGRYVEFLVTADLNRPIFRDAPKLFLVFQDYCQPGTSASASAWPTLMKPLRNPPEFVHGNIST